MWPVAWEHMAGYPLICLKELLQNISHLGGVGFWFDSWRSGPWRGLGLPGKKGRHLCLRSQD